MTTTRLVVLFFSLAFSAGIATANPVPKELQGTYKLDVEGTIDAMAKEAGWKEENRAPYTQQLKMFEAVRVVVTSNRIDMKSPEAPETFTITSAKRNGNQHVLSFVSKDDGEEHKGEFVIVSKGKTHVEFPSVMQKMLWSKIKK